MSVDFALVDMVLAELEQLVEERAEAVARPGREARGVEVVREDDETEGGAS